VCDGDREDGSRIALAETPRALRPAGARADQSRARTRVRPAPSPARVARWRERRGSDRSPLDVSSSSAATLGRPPARSPALRVRRPSRWPESTALCLVRTRRRATSRDRSRSPAVRGGYARCNVRTFMSRLASQPKPPTEPEPAPAPHVPVPVPKPNEPPDPFPQPPLPQVPEPKHYPIHPDIPEEPIHAPRMAVLRAGTCVQNAACIAPETVGRSS